ERAGPVETVCLRKDGAKLHVLLALSPVTDAQGKIIGISSIAHDVTDRRRMLEERARADLLQQVEETRQEAARRKDQFLAVLGHELRNPLSPIRNAVNVMRQFDVADPILCQAIDMID